MFCCSYRRPLVQALPLSGVVPPLTLWRLDVGALRISHFMDNHVMQALRLLTWLLMKQPQPLRHVAITAAASAWAIVTVWLLQRALSNTGFL